ncbi:hypothetical protein ACFL27_03155 [candidate division CSSED10-310 bacterium]|uniref:DUF3267 domain-containing protein n=1 Tax=candidate division CSSED10-310 bacterium TaxID=2855610 RepID=A0ABV6YSQ1_UNCC1
MWKLIKIVGWFLAPPGILAYGKTLLSHDYAAGWELIQVQIAGFSASVGIVCWLLLRRRVRFFHVFDHELTHLIFGLFFFYKPKVFVASDKDGMVGLYGNNFFITLAPYYFPVYSYFLLLLYPLLRPEIYPYFFALLGLTTGYHLSSKLQDFRFSQPDIMHEGRIFSIIFCLFGSIISFGCLFFFVSGGFPGALTYLKSGIEVLMFLISAALNFLSAPH